MGFLVSVLLFLVVDVFVLWYLLSSQYFGPYNVSGDINLWNIAVFVTLVSFAAGLVTSGMVYVLEKIFSCGKKEFPRPVRSLRFGLLVTFCLEVGLFLHIFHLLNFGVLLVLFFLVIVGIVLVR